VALQHWVLKDARTQRRLLYVLVGATAFYVADMLFQYFVGVDVFGYKKVPYGSGETLRLTGPFGETRVGVITTWLIFPALLYVCALKPKKYLLLAVLFIATYLAAVYVSGERMALLLALMGVGISLLFVKVARVPILVAMACGALAFAAMNHANPSLSDRQVNQSQREIAGYSQSAYGQLVLSAVAMVKEHPLFGVGPKHFRKLCPDAAYGDTSKEALYLRCSLHPHNIYAELLAETGLIGGFLFLAIIGVWVRECLRHFRRTLSDPVLAGITIGVIIKLWPLAATSSFFVGWSAVPMWLFVGWMLARQKVTA
jgi:O-antigen ligase